MDNAQLIIPYHNNIYILLWHNEFGSVFILGLVTLFLVLYQWIFGIVYKINVIVLSSHSPEMRGYAPHRESKIACYFRRYASGEKTLHPGFGRSNYGYNMISYTYN